MHMQAFYIRYNHYVTSSQSVLFNEIKRLFDGLFILISAYLKSTP